MATPTLSDLKTHLDITDSTDDAELTAYLSAARAQIERRVGYLAATSVSETVRARGAMFLLSHRPIQSITTVAAATSTTPTFVAADLSFDGRAGTVWLTDGGDLSGTYVITYSSGMATVPDAVFLAVLITARHLWNTKRGNTRRPSEDSSFQSASGAGYALPWQAIELIAPYDLMQGVA